MGREQGVVAFFVCVCVCVGGAAVTTNALQNVGVSDPSMEMLDMNGCSSHFSSFVHGL